MFAFGHGFAAASRRVVLSLGFCLAALGAPLAFAQTATNVATITPPSGVTNTGAACIAANGSGAFNSTTGVCTATDSDTVVTPQLTFTKTHTGNFVVGTNGTYTLTVSNTGTAPTSGTITVTDTLPTGLTFVSATGTGWTCSFASPTVTCTSTTVIPAGSAGSPITLTVAVGAAAAPSVTNTARASGGGDLTCPASGTTDPRCTPSDPTTVNTPANIAVAKTGPATVTAGTSYQYTLAVSNSGQTASGTNVIVQDQLPAGVIATAVTGANCGTLPSAAGALLTCTIPGPIAAGGSVNVVLTVTAPATGGSITNYAATNPTGTGNPGTPPGPGCTNNATTNCSSAATTVNAPQLSFTKTHTGNFVVGTNGTYTLTVSNTGTAPTTGTITVTDTLPTGLTFVSATGTGWTCSFASPTVTCTSTTAIAAGATGSPITLTVAVGAAAAPSVTNTARASGGGDTTCPASGGTQARCNPSDPTTVNTPANIAVAKTGPATVTAGTSYQYTLAVSNSGQTASGTNVIVQDQLPAGVIATAVTGANCGTLPSAAGALLTCTIPGPIAAGGSVNVVLTVTAPATGGSITNYAATNPTGTGNPGTPPGPGCTNNATTNCSSAATTVNAPQLSFTKTHTGNFVVGTNGTYTLTVSNTGTAPTTGTITVTDTLPTGLTFVSATGTGWTCSFASPTVTCTSTTAIAAGATGSPITLTVAVGAAAAPSVTNTARASGGGDTTCPASGGTQARCNPSDPTTVTASADVSVTKTLTTVGPYLIGQTVSFNIVVSNAGPSPATNVQVTDTLTNLTSGTVSGACTAFPCTIASIASGSTATITVTGTIQADGAFSNSATATPTETDPNTGNNTGTDGDNTTPTADVSVTKTLTTAGPFQTGQTVTYTVTVANAGPSTATNVQVTDTPTNLTITGVSGGGCTAFPCTIASLASGASVTITVTATINAQGTFQNSATATTPDQTDPNPPNNTSTTPPETAGGVADVSVVKTLTTAGPFQTGQAVTYTVTVANAGPDAATNVQVTDTPTNLTITGVSGGGCTAFPCTIASLASGASVTITVTATINAQGTFQNSATATTPDQTDPNPPNNTSTTPPETAGGVADVSVVKTLTTAGPFQTGQAVTYTVTVANAGPDAATNVQVTDTPTNLTITGVSGGGCTAFPCTIASLASGASVTITVTATINAQGTFQNSATATTPDQTDPNPPNNTSTTPPETAGGVADVSVVKTLTTTGPILAGQSIQFDIVVTNAGPDAATNVQVTDTPTNLTITGVSGGGCTAFPCTLASLASGASATITVTATVGVTGGAFNNVATVTVPDQTDPNTSNNTDDEPGTAGALPIIANDDSGSANGATGGVAVPNVLTNDTLNGAPATLSNVTLTQTSTTNPNVTLDPATGAVNVAPGTPAGTYTVVYQICEQLNPTNCDTANVTVTVSAAPIDAVDDSGSANGASGGVAVPNVLTNDTLNGAPATLSNVTLTQTSTTNPNVTLDPATGAVNVAPGTPAGTYTVVYQICEQLNPTNCDTANVTVTVSAAPIDAVDDSGSANGASGGTAVPNVLVNDTLNGAAATLANVTLTQTSTTNPNVTLDPATGAVNVAPGTPAGTYTVVYQICEQLNPTNCDTANVTVTVSAAPIDAVDDSGSANGASGGVAVPNVLTNDTLNGAPATLSNVTLTQTSTTNPNVTLDPATGAVNVAPGTPAGTYTVVYQICEQLNPTNCDTANVTVTVSAAPIDAVDDSGSANGASGGTAVPNVLVNDTLNGAPATLSNVTLTQTSTTNPNVTLDPATGAVNVAPGTPAGTYTVVYQICEQLNPTNCDTANVTVTVSAAPIDAVDDSGSANGASGGVAVPNVLTNDTLNGAPATLSNVTLTQTSTTNPNVTLDPATGAVNVAPGTPAGTYTVVYQICEQLNPTNCDTANVTVTVSAAPIDAVDDSGSANGASGGVAVPNVLTNDTLNGAPATLSNVTLTQTSTTNPNVTLDPATGAVNVAPGTPAGTYTVVYQICEQLNPTNCDTANVTVTVSAAPIDAVDDSGSANGASGGVAVPNVLTNDTLNGAPATLSNVTLTQTSTTNPNVTLDPATGAVNVAPGTPAGTYTVVYQICEQLNPTNCDTANVTVTVSAAPIDAVDDSGSANGASGGTAVPNVLTNDTLNGAPATLSNVTLTQTSTTNPNVTLDPATGAVNVAPGTPAGTYTVVYQICEQLNPTNCDTANVTVTVSAAPIDAVDDSGSANGASGGVAVPNVLTNDTLNGAPATLANVTLTQTSTTNPNVTLDPATGAVNVAPGTPAGTYTVVYQICETLNPTNCDTANVTVTVSAAAITATDDPATTPQNTPVTIPVLSNDTLNGVPVTTSTVTTTVTTPPANGTTTINPDGTITYTPNPGFSGTDTFTYQICETLNPSNCDTATVTVTVAANTVDAINDTATTPQNSPVTTPVLGNDTTTGAPLDPGSVTVTVQPPNGTTTVNPDGSITYTPKPGFSGTDTYTYQVCDTSTPTPVCDTATVTVTVAANTVDAVNDTATTPQNSPVTTPVLGNDTTTGAPLDPSSVTVTVQPPNGTTTVNPDGSITYTPKPGFSGTDTYTYQVCDTSTPTPVCDTATVTVTVAANTVDAVNDTATTPQNSPVTTPVLGNDTTTGAPLDPSSVTVTVQPPNGTTTVNPDGTITYTPKPGFSGTDTYTYQVCDTSTPTPVCDTATVTVTVQPNVVTAVDDTAETPANQPVTIPVLDNDTVTGSPLDPGSVTITVPPSNGTVTVNDDGTIVYTPNPNFIGTDTFTYQVCDTSTPTPVCDTATVTVNVKGQPPVANPDPDAGTGTPGQPVTIPVLGNDTDPDNNIDPGTVVIVGAPGDGKMLVVPGEGTWQVNPDGTITFTPEEDFVGTTKPIEYTVSDTTGLKSNPAQVSVEIKSAARVHVIKTASPRDVKIGDLVRYTVTMENTGESDLVNGVLIDTPPAGFTYVNNSLTVADRDGAGRLTGTYPISVDQIDIKSGERATVVYLLRVGAGVGAGIHTNHAIVQERGTTISNDATANVQLVADPLLDESLIIGTAYDDRDGDGWQDSATMTGVHVQGGFAPGAYVPNSTTVDRGKGPAPEPDASSPMLHGIAIGEVSGRQSEADTVDAHKVVVSQKLSSLDFTDDFVLTTKQGVSVRMDASGKTRIERGSGDAAKGLTGAEPTVERRVSQTDGGYRVDYVIGNAGIDERGIPGVRIASVEGLIVETDQFGRYNLIGIDGGPANRGRNFILKVDPATLPPGSVFTTDNPQVRRITPGLPVRFDFGIKLPSGLIEGKSDEQVEMELGEVMFDDASAKLREQYLPVIDKMAEQVKQHSGGEVVIAANGESQALAYDRAKAVQSALLAQLSPEQAKSLQVSLRTDVADAGSTLLKLDGQSRLLGDVLFDTDKSEIKPEFAPVIEKIAADIDKLGTGTVGVVGHADKRGAPAYNDALALRRAKAVYEAIAAKLSPEVRSKLRVEISDNPTAPVGSSK